MIDHDLDDLAARVRQGQAITLDEHRALNAARRVPDQFASLGRGTVAERYGEDRDDDMTRPRYGRR